MTQAKTSTLEVKTNGFAHAYGVCDESGVSREQIGVLTATQRKTNGFAHAYGVCDVSGVSREQIGVLGGVRRSRGMVRERGGGGYFWRVISNKSPS